jgi:hypothetical protein
LRKLSFREGGAWAILLLLTCGSILLSVGFISASPGINISVQLDDSIVNPGQTITVNGIVDEDGAPLDNAIVLLSLDGTPQLLSWGMPASAPWERGTFENTIIEANKLKIRYKPDLDILFIDNISGSICWIDPYGEVKSLGIVAHQLGPVGDVDGDGKPDVVFKDTPRGSPGPLKYVDKDNTIRTLVSANVLYVAKEMADFDGDGLPEIPYVSGSYDRKIYFVDKDGQTQSVSIPNYGLLLGGVGDIDGDGRPEVVFGYRDNIYHIDFNGECAAMAGIVDFHQTDRRSEIGEVGDFDGDGLQDVPLIPKGSFSTLWLTDNSRNLRQILSSNTVWGGLGSVGGMADFNQDGRMDIAYLRYENAVLMLVDNSGARRGLGVIAKWVGGIIDFDQDTGYVPFGRYTTPTVDWRSPSIRIENITITVTVPPETRVEILTQVSDDNFSTVKSENLLILTPGMGGTNRVYPVSLPPARYARVIFSLHTNDLTRSPVITSFTLRTNTVTADNGWFRYVLEAPTQLGTHEIKARVERGSSWGEGSATFDVRRLKVENFGLLDDHGQIDNILNPGEKYYVLVRIREENGTHLYDVTSGSFTENIGGTLYTLVHWENSVWRTVNQFTAPTSLGSYSFTSVVSGTSGQGIVGSASVFQSYKVKTIELSIFFERSWVNPRDNVIIYGRAKLWPDNIWVENAEVNIFVSGQYVATVQTGSGENAGMYRYVYQAPPTLGRYPVRVTISSGGIDRENTSAFYVKTLTITVDMDPASHQVRPGVRVKIYGYVKRWPEGAPASYATVRLRMGPLDNYENVNWPVGDNVARADGYYEINFRVREEWVGEFKLVVKATDNYLLENENWTWMLSETIKISVYFSRSNVPPGTYIHVWGWAIFQPSGVPVRNTLVSIWPWEGADEDSTWTDNEGRYDYFFYAPQQWGNYTFKVRVTSAGLTGENRYQYMVSVILISLNFNDKIVNKGQEITISGRAVLVPANEPVRNRVFPYSVGWRPGYTYTATNENGDYSITEFAPNAVGRYRVWVGISQDDFTGENADNIEVWEMILSVFLSKTKANPGERIWVSGISTVRLPGGENRPPPGGTRVNIYVNDRLWTQAFTGTDGSYSKDISAPDVGVHTITVWCADNENIIGENSTTLYVERIVITANVDRDPANPREANRLWGYAWYQYSGDPVENDVKIKIDGSLVATVRTTPSGYYEYRFDSPATPGQHLIEVSILHENFRGENSRTFWIRVLNVPANLSDGVVRRSQTVTVSGRITVQPGGWPVPRWTMVRIEPSWTSPITTYTDSTGFYNQDIIAPSSPGRYSIYVYAEEPENLIRGTGENSLEVRDIYFSEFGLLDSHGQTDRILNPGENYRLFVRIQEFNGSMYEDVESAHPSNPFKVTVNTIDYTLTYTGTRGVWISPDLYAETQLGTRYLSAFFSGASENDIYGTYTIAYSYDVKTVWLSMSFDNAVNPGENTKISGTAILLPDGTPVRRENVTIRKDAEPMTIVQTDALGNYSYSFLAPTSLENYLLSVTLTTPQGIEGENSGRQWVKTIEISIFLGMQVVGAAETNNVSGYVILWPDNVPIHGLQVRVSGSGLDNEQVTYTNDQGYYFLEFRISNFARNYGYGEVRVQVRNPDNIYGENAENYYVGTPVVVRGVMKSADWQTIPTTFEFKSRSIPSTLRISVRPDGSYYGVIIKDNYDLTVKFLGHSITFYDVKTFSGAFQWENFDNLIRLDNVPRPAAYVADNVNTILAVAIEISGRLADNFQTATLVLNYSPELWRVNDESKLAVYCASWDMVRRENTGRWMKLGGTIDKVSHTITLTGLRSFSAYVVGETIPSMQDVVGPIFGPLVGPIQGPIIGPLRGPIPDYSGTLRWILNLLSDVQQLMENMPALENLPMTPPVEVTPSPSAGVSLDK